VISRWLHDGRRSQKDTRMEYKSLQIYKGEMSSSDTEKSDWRECYVLVD